MLKLKMLLFQISQKDKSLKSVLDYLKSDDISLPPKYYRLEGLFKYIGCGNSIVTETLKLHDEMLERTDSTICRISGERDNYDSEIYNVKFIKKGNYLEIVFVGKSFYRYMVRNMIGALILVGRNKISVSDFSKMIEVGENIYTYMTVPASGLYLEKVEY